LLALVGPNQLHSEPAVEARVVGVPPAVDLALHQVDVAHLPTLPLANYDALGQGELVFVFGSPEGLRNSVTMGVVSAVARQPDADHPMVYLGAAQITAAGATALMS